MTAPGSQYKFDITGNDLLALRNMVAQISYWQMDGIIQTFGQTTDANAEVETLRTLSEQSSLQLPCHAFLLNAVKYAITEKKMDTTINLNICGAWYDWISKAAWSERLDPTHPAQIAQLEARGRSVSEYANQIDRIRECLAAAYADGGEPEMTMRAPAGHQ